MAMDRAAFEALIARMEALALGNPAVYRRRVYALALLGYGYIVLVAPLLLARRSMWTRMETPAGERLTRAMAPGLFQMIDDLRERLRTPVLDEVVLTSGFNAGVM